LEHNEVLKFPSYLQAVIGNGLPDIG